MYCPVVSIRPTTMGSGPIEAFEISHEPDLVLCGPVTNIGT